MRGNEPHAITTLQEIVPVSHKLSERHGSSWLRDFLRHLSLEVPTIVLGIVLGLYLSDAVQSKQRRSDIQASLQLLSAELEQNERCLDADRIVFESFWSGMDSLQECCRRSTTLDDVFDCGDKVKAQSDDNMSRELSTLGLMATSAAWKSVSLPEMRQALTPQQLTTISSAHALLEGYKQQNYFVDLSKCVFSIDSMKEAVTKQMEANLEGATSEQDLMAVMCQNIELVIAELTTEIRTARLAWHHVVSCIEGIRAARTVLEKVQSESGG
ncbi:MAG: hypothetical protein IPK60_20700 [Sandaracinaceae bacterium]|nr:hypothetical protein [Sandaracinaceae bacterium]